MKKSVDFAQVIGDTVFMIKTVKLTNGKRVPLRKHQTEAITNAITHFEEGHDRASIVHCCRSGKSLTSVALHKELKSKSSVVFLPSINLIQQTISDWQVNLPRARILVISCDKTVHSGEVTTSPKKIRDFINRSIGSEFVIFCTYQSSKKLCKALSKVDSFAFDFVVADEAHRSAGVNLKSSRYIHFNSCISAKKRLYMTATPKFVSSGLRRFLHEDAKISCMSDESVFGKQVHVFSFREGIESNILSDYEIVALGCKNQSKTEAVNDRTNVDHVNIKETAKLHALHKALSSRDVTHCVSFHSKKPKAKFFEENFQLEGWKVFHINGDHSAEERKKTLDAFKKADKALLTNCKCLNEGVNLVECDSVFFSDVKSGAVDVVQSASRPLTKDPSKPKSFLNAIFIPTFHFETDSIERICETASHKILIQLIRHMRGQDERIEAFLTRLARGGSASSSDEVEDILKVEGFDGLTEDIFESIIPSDIQRFSEMECVNAFKNSFDGVKGGMQTASVNLGMPPHYLRLRAQKSTWLRNQFEEIKKDMQITNNQVFNAIVENKGNITKASLSLGKSLGFISMRLEAQPKLASRLKAWLEDHPEFNPTNRKVFHTFDEIVDAFREAGYHKNNAGVLLGQTKDYINGVESRKPELKEILFEVSLEIKPEGMSDEEFRHEIRFGGASNLLKKQKWAREINRIVKEDPRKSASKISEIVGCSRTFAYGIKRRLSKGDKLAELF